MRAMMLALALAQPAAAGSPVMDRPSVEAESEIVVIARTMHRMRISYANNGRYLRSCVITRSSGDERLDRIACAMLKVCVAEGHVEAAAARDCLYARIDMQADEAEGKSGAAPDPSDMGDVAITGAPIALIPGLWTFERSSAATLAQGGVQALPQVGYSLCVPDSSTAVALEALLQDHFDRSGAWQCGRKTIRLVDGALSVTTLCRSGALSAAWRLSGQVTPAQIDVAVSVRAGEEGRATDFHYQWTGRQAGDCPP